MGYYRSLLEVKRTVNGEEQDLDSEKENDNQDDYDLDKESNDDDHEVNDGYNNYDLDDEMGSNDSGNDNNDDGNDNNNNDNPDDNNNNDQQTDPDSNNDNEHDVDDTDNNYDLDDEMGNDDNNDNPDSNDNVDSNDDNSLGDTSGGDDNTSVGSSDMGSGDQEDPDAKIKEIENSIGTLSPEQIKLQNVNLKKQYIELYNNCSNIVERINTKNKTNDNENQISFIIQTLQDLKKVMYDYLIDTYNTKTFTQNSINYTEYLVTLNSVNKLLKDINTKNKNI